MALAEWVAKGEPPFDVWPVDIRRFGRNHLDTDWVRTRTLEAYAKHYTMAWPHEEYHRGRPLRRSPLWQRLQGPGRLLRREAGLGAAQLVRRPRRGAGRRSQLRPRRTGSRPSAASTGPAASASALFDQTSFAKFLLVGRDAEAALSWLCANDVAKPPGSLTYTQMLNARGGIECDLTVARLGRRPLLHRHRHRLRHPRFRLDRPPHPRRPRRAPDRRHQRACRAVAVRPAGRARSWAAVTADPIDNAAFPFGTWRRLRVAGAPVMALRVTYVGELGWELHVPVEFALTVYDALMEAGAAARARQRRLPGDRIAAAGEGLPRLGRRHRPGPLAARWRAWAGR